MLFSANVLVRGWDHTHERGRKASGTLRERTRILDKLLNPHSLGIGSQLHSGCD